MQQTVATSWCNKQIIWHMVRQEYSHLFQDPLVFLGHPTKPKTFTAGFRLIRSFEYEADARIEVIWPVIQEFQAAQVSHPDRVVHPNQPLLYLPAHACAHIQKLSILTRPWQTYTQKTLSKSIKKKSQFLGWLTDPIFVTNKTFLTASHICMPKAAVIGLINVINSINKPTQWLWKETEKG